MRLRACAGRTAAALALLLASLPLAGQPSPVSRDTIGSGGSSVTARGASGVTIAPKAGTALTVNGDTRLKGREPWYDVTAYGAKVNDGLDDTTAIQAAVTAAGQAGGGIVRFPAGQLDISIQTSQSPIANPGYAVVLSYSHVTLQGAGMDRTVIRLKDAADPTVPVYYTSIFCRNAVIDDVHVRDLTIDQNTPGNPIPPSYVMSSGRRNVLMLCDSASPTVNVGNNLSVERCRLTNVCGTQAIVVSGKGSRVSGCTIDQIGNTYWSGSAGRDFDTSEIFVDNGDGVIVENNTILGRGPLAAESPGAAGAFAARTAIETHSRKLVVRNNFISGLRYGANITAYPTVGDPNPSLYDQQIIQGNTVAECHCGFRLWSHWTIPVAAASNTSPIEITTTIPHGLSTGDMVETDGIPGNVNANVSVATLVTVTGPNTFTLDGTTGSGTFGGGGNIGGIGGIPVTNGGEVTVGGDWSTRDPAIVGRGIDGMEVVDNTILLNRMGWTNASAASFSLANTAPRGIWLDSGNTAGTRDLTVSRNIIRFVGGAGSSSADGNSDGIYLSTIVNSQGLTGTVGSPTGLQNIVNKNFKVTDNLISRPVASGVHLSCRIRSCDITGNIVINPGQATVASGVSNLNFAGVHLFGHLDGITVANNQTVDDQATPTTAWGLNTSETYTAARCMASNNRLRVTTPGASTIVAFHGKSTTGAEWLVQQTDDPIGTTEYRSARFGSEVREMASARIVQQVAAGAGTSWRSVSYGTSAPITGTWSQGDLIWNTQPTIGGNMGWVCTASGTPGTWSAWNENLSGAGAWQTDAISEKTGGAGVTFTGVVKAGSGLSVGGSPTILHILHGSATLDFPNTPANSISELTMTVTGVSNADILAELGVGKNGWPPAGGSYAAYVSADNTVTVRFVNNTTSAINPTAAVFEVEVHQY